MSQLAAALRKEILLQWRTRAQILAIFIFGATALLLFSFAIGPKSTLIIAIAAECRPPSRVFTPSLISR